VVDTVEALNILVESLEGGEINIKVSVHKNGNETNLITKIYSLIKGSNRYKNPF
jgi:hypothetical protein